MGWKETWDIDRSTWNPGRPWQAAELHGDLRERARERASKRVVPVVRACFFLVLFKNWTFFYTKYLTDCDIWYITEMIIFASWTGLHSAWPLHTQQRVFTDLETFQHLLQGSIFSTRSYIISLNRSITEGITKSAGLELADRSTKLKDKEKIER